MPRYTGQKLKLLVLARLLEERTDEDHPMTIAQMISALDAAGIRAERKSLYDDLQSLEDFGLDVVRTKGKSTGYFIGSRDFELPELRLLVDAVQSSRFLTKKKSEELIRKLQRLTSVHEAGKLSHVVSVAGRVKTMNESIYRNVDALSAAIEADRQVSFQYFDRDLSGEKVLRRGGERYAVSPCLLNWDNENYYLIGVEQKSGEIRHFRVDKMLSIREEEEKRAFPPGFQMPDSARYERMTFGMYGGEEARVTLAAPEDLVGVFFDRFGKEIVLRRREDGFETTVPVQVSPVFLGWVASFGGRVRILSPAPVREDLRRLAQALLETHGE